MALLSFVESSPRAYRLKASNAASPISTFQHRSGQFRGLLGRPVKLIYYDDQSSPAAVPAIYEKLLDVDKVDTIIGGYGTNMLAAAMPGVIQRRKMLIGLFGLAVNAEFGYPKYFSMIPLGPNR